MKLEAFFKIEFPLNCSFPGHSESAFAHLSWLQMVQVTSHLFLTSASHDLFFFASFLLKPKCWLQLDH